MAKAFSLDTKSGHHIHGHHFSTENTANAVVIIAPALGVAQPYYFAFANWLANKGADVLTFDYHGMGQSTSRAMKQTSVSISDWVNQDCVAIISHAKQLANDKPVYWIGHSLGGQIFGMIPNRQDVQHLVTIASGSGYWGHSNTMLKLKSLMLWYGIVPIVTPSCGYFPGSKLKLIGDMPAKVMYQWRKWCLNADYLVGAEAAHYRQFYQALTIPISAFAFADDELISYRAFEHLHDFYASADKTLYRYAPEDIEENRIGHFGFFKAKYQQTLWQKVALALDISG